MSYRINNKWSVDKIQPIAIKKIYNKMWPNATIIELDNDTRNILKSILDRSGSDKLIKFSDGNIAFPKFLKLVVDKRLLPNDRIQTNSGDAEFLCWGFSRIPKSCIVFDTTEKITLSTFFG